MKFLLKPFIVIMLTAVSSSAFAQKVTAALVEKEGGAPVPYATVSITPQGSTSPGKYVLSTNEGKVEFTGVKAGKYTVKVELLGYKALVRDVEIKGGESRNLGVLQLETDNQMLEAARVTDVGNPINIKKDTIEYNASSFKTSESDMLIDLLKKLPGIEVESDGTITANGQTIKKITIDGKTFFLDDPQLASKNIPSKLIEKVKVVEKKSDQAMFTGIDDGEEETVIDLGIKKGMFKGWFGNVMAGGGHDIPSPSNDMNDWRWQGAGFVGNFTDKQQISVILNANNTNNRGFNDMASSMMGNMRGGGMGRGNNTGITTSWMAGVNGAWSLLDKRMDLSGNYLYSGSDRNVLESSAKDTYLSGGETLSNTTAGSNHSSNQGHRVGIRLDHKFSDNTSILFEPRFEAGMGRYAETSSFNTDRRGAGGDTVHVNDGRTFTDGINDNWTTRGFGLLRQRLGKAGRTLTVNFNYNFSNNNLRDGHNVSVNNVVETGQKDTVNQKIDQRAKNSQLGAGFTYTEPLWEQKLFLEANYSYSWRQQTSEKNTFDNIVGARDEVYSRSILNQSQTHKAGANLMYQLNKFRTQLGFSANPTYTYNKTNGREYLPGNKGWVVNWAPQATLTYDFTDNSNVRFFYWGRSNQPSTSQLMPTPDNADPLNIKLGNPYLMPYFNHSLRGMFRFTDKKSFTSVNAYLDGSIVDNPIGSTTWFDESGAQFSFPTNVPTSYNANLRVMVNSPIAKSGFSIFSMTRFGYGNTRNYVSNGTLDMSPYYVGGDKFNFDYEKFHTDYPTLDGSSDFSTNNTQTLSFIQRLRLTYRNDFVELVGGARTRMNKSWYTVSKGNTNTTWSNQAEASMNWTLPWDINLIAQFQYNWYNGYTTAQPSSAVLNAEITKMFYKKKFTLSLKGYDLLAQASNLSVSDTDNYHQETRNNTLGRYVILSLTYRFGTFNRDAMRRPGGPPRR